MKMRQTLVLSLMIGLLVVPLAASADEHEMAPQPLTWISFVQAQPGKSGPLTQNLAKNDAKVYDPLMADGHILTWGVGMPVNHWPDDDWNVVEWVTFRDWAAVDAFMQAFMGMQMSKSPEEMAAEQEEWLSLTVPGSHHDQIQRHMVVMPTDGPPPAYFSLTYVPVKPGQGEKLKKIWVDNIQPTLTDLQAAGTIGAFGLAADEVHNGSGVTFLSWTALPNLAARDAVDAAMEAAAMKRGEEAQKAMMTDLMSAADFSGHSDRILMVTHSGGSGGGNE